MFGEGKCAAPDFDRQAAAFFSDRNCYYFAYGIALFVRPLFCRFALKVKGTNANVKRLFKMCLS